jgi:hypothetical protein
VKVQPPKKYQDLLDAMGGPASDPNDGALLLLNKQEANVLLEALEMFGSIHDAIPGGSAEGTFSIIDKIAAAGKKAGWEAQVDIKATTTVNIAGNFGSHFESTPPPSPPETD